MPPVWVNMIQRTQTSHMPDPDDPTPVWQGISVYYGSLNVGGVSFAILEDRKWKSSPTVVLPDARIINGWSKVPAYDAATDGDVAGAVLLGQRQLDYLDTWAADWSAGTWMKVVISQTIFANVATLPRADADSDEITPRLRVLPPGGYAEDDVRVQDHDSNGWPQTGRNKALERMRRAFAFHIAGDQHLGSTVQYGIDDWRDAGFAICVPSVANIWPRRWFPSSADGHNRKSGAPPYTGDFLDGFGNKVTVLAVSNPHTVTVEPQWINLRAPGYGIISFHRESRKITMANWPRWVDASQPDAKPYPGWPVTIDQMDNYGREAVAYLPTVKVQGVTDPVVQVIDESNNEIVYTIRITGNAFQPKVFREGSYTIRVGEPNTPRMRTFEHVQTAPVSDHATLTVEL